MEDEFPCEKVGYEKEPSREVKLWVLKRVSMYYTQKFIYKINFVLHLLGLKTKIAFLMGALFLVMHLISSIENSLMHFRFLFVLNL